MMSANGKRVGVLLGGFSAERDASVRSGEAVLKVLRERGHEAVPIFVDREVDLALRQSQIEVAFMALRGRYAGDGCLQGLLEVMGLPYTGSGVLASSIAMNRAKTKEILRLANLPTAPAYVLRADSPRAVVEAHGSFGFPVVVRAAGAPTVGPSAIVRDELELEAAAEDAFRVDEEIIVERSLEGRAVLVAVLDGVALGATEAPSSGGRRGEMVTSRISSARYRSLLRLATAAYEAIGCDSAALVEMVVSEKQNEVIVGIDTAPLMAPTAPLARIAHASGIKYGDLLEEVLKGARMRAHGHRNNRRALDLTTFQGPERRSSAATAAH